MRADAAFALCVFECGLSVINQVAHLARDNVGKVEISESASFDPIALPHWDTRSASRTS